MSKGYIYTLGTFTVCRITQSWTHRYLTAARFICYKKNIPRYVSRASADRREISKCVAAASQLSSLEFLYDKRTGPVNPPQGPLLLYAFNPSMHSGYYMCHLL
jgi:hypothetical protein